MLPQVIEKLRENGKQIDVVVIETIQKLRDITIDDIMNGKTKSLHLMIGENVRHVLFICIDMFLSYKNNINSI